MTVSPASSSTPTLAQPAPKALDPIQQILAMTNEEIMQKGIPMPLFLAWRDAFYEGFAKESSITVISRLTNWAVDRSLLETDPNHLQNFFAKFSWIRSSDIIDNPYNQRNILKNLYKLQHTTFFALNDPVQQVFIRLMDCLAEKIARETPQFQNAPFFSLPLNGIRNPYTEFKQLFLFKTVNGWRVGEFDRFPNVKNHVVQFNINNTQMLILDDKEQPIDRPCNIIQAKMRPFEETWNEMRLDVNLVNPPKVDIVLCSGTDALYRGQDNATTFTFDVDRTVNPPQMIRFKQNAPCVDASTHLVSKHNLALAQAEAEVMFESFKSQFGSIQEYAKPMIFELSAPQSREDKLAVASYMLLEWKKNPVENAEFINEAANLLGCEFSKEEVANLEKTEQAKATKDGYEIFPKAVVEKLVTTTTTAWKKAMQAPAAKTVAVETKTAPPEQAAATQQIQLEKQVEKARRKAAFDLEQKKQTAVETAAEKVTEQPVSLLGASPKDRDKVESIYAGNPMGAKNFATFAIGLLRKKAAAVGASVQSHTKGSHPKLHFKKADGTSGGVTFKIHHGGDGHGFLAAQKETLKRIFDL